MKSTIPTKSLNVHGVPVLCALLAMAFALFAYWDLLRLDIYEVCARALRDDAIREVGVLLDAIAQETTHVHQIKPWSKDAPEGTVMNFVQLRFPSYLVMEIEFDETSGLISSTELIYFDSVYVHPDSDPPPSVRGAFYHIFPIAYALVAIVLWYAFRLIKSRRIVSIMRWIIGLLLLPLVARAMMIALFFHLCYRSTNLPPPFVP